MCSSLSRELGELREAESGRNPNFSILHDQGPGSRAPAVLLGVFSSPGSLPTTFQLELLKSAGGMLSHPLGIPLSEERPVSDPEHSQLGQPQQRHGVAQHSQPEFQLLPSPATHTICPGSGETASTS